MVLIWPRNDVLSSGGGTAGELTGGLNMPDWGPSCKRNGTISYGEGEGGVAGKVPSFWHPCEL